MGLLIPHLPVCIPARHYGRLGGPAGAGPPPALLM